MKKHPYYKNENLEKEFHPERYIVVIGLIIILLIIGIEAFGQSHCQMNIKKPFTERKEVYTPYIAASMTATIFPTVNYYDRVFDPTPEQRATLALSLMATTYVVFRVEQHVKRKIHRYKYRRYRSPYCG